MRPGRGEGEIIRLRLSAGGGDERFAKRIWLKMTCQLFIHVYLVGGGNRFAGLPSSNFFSFLGLEAAAGGGNKGSGGGEERGGEM